MTVSELAEKLESFEPDMEVWIQDGSAVADVALSEGKQYVVIISGTEED
jgi:hypothetical protein